MPEIIKTYTQSVPAVRFIGKKYSDGSHWSEWFANDCFSAVENAIVGENSVHQLYEDGDAYLGLMRFKENEPFEYWIGEFVFPGTEAPEGFEYKDFSQARLGVCWIYGKENEVSSLGGKCSEKLSEAGYEISADENGAIWCFERYGCPRFTTPDENGNIIMDFCYFIK